MLSHLNQHYNIFYFFTQNCNTCKIFTPILQSITTNDSLRITKVQF
ncbi:conjugal transfer protein TraF [Klebsiella pneumoniae]